MGRYMITIAMCIWKRPALTKIVIDYYKELAKKYPLEIVTCGSEGEVSKKLCEGTHYIEAPNSPLSNKHNTLLSKCKELNPDGVILIGSDDFISDKVIEHYLTFKNKDQYIGATECFFYNPLSDSLIYFLNRQQSIGAGRYYTKQVLDKMKWTLWYGEMDKSLDYNSLMYLSFNGVKETNYSLSDIDGFILDVKYAENLTNFDTLSSLSLKISSGLIEKYLGREVADKLMELK